MFGVSRTKKVTYALLNYEAIAQIVKPHYISSDSEHRAEADVIGDILFNFAADEDESPPSKSPSPNDSDPEKDRSIDTNVADQIRSILEDDSDKFRNALKAHVLRALQLSAHEDDEQVLTRKVMGRLRELGYDAPVCKTKWRSGGGVTAGEYEFVDVVVSEGDLRVRYFVDVDFRSEFVLARPTGSYELGLQSLPRVFVGRGEELKAILRAMSDAAKRSFKSSGLLTPPWRKHRFLQNMWLGGHRRAVNAETTFRAKGVVRRVVGFDVSG